MTTLGERLRNTIEVQEAARLAAIAQAEQARRNEEDARIEAMVRKLTEYKNMITSTIENGMVFKDVKLPKSWCCYSDKRGNYSISNIQHPDYELWREFSNWAETEGLAVEAVYEHDGMGMDSWYVLRVTPQ